ncbi:MAG: serine/threonine-protein kinase [bacterium]
MTLLGKTIGHFHVTELIGEGGMGEVYLAYDERLKRRVALKVIHSDRGFDQRIKTRLIKEAEILSRLEHPHICRIYDLLETKDADVLVLELIKGQTLDKVPSDSLSHADRLKIAIQLGEVLAVAHAHSVVHRDLKPENVMLDNRGDIKVLDFGLAHSNSDQDTHILVRPDRTADDSRSGTPPIDPVPGGGFRTEHGLIMGTPMYMSLEQALARPVTAASDMYSYGLLLQWLFTGSPPYPADLSPAMIFARASKGDTLQPEGVQDDLKALIERLKSVDPTRRPTAVDMVEHLKRIVEVPKRRARRRALIGIICVLSIGILISGFSWYRVRESERLKRIALSRQEKMSEFLVEMWVSPSPMEHGRDVKVIDVLAYGKEQVEKEFQDDPLTKATLLNHLATTYRRLGDYAQAETLITECLDFCRKTLGPDHSRTISAMIEMGILYNFDERFPEAEALFREALDAGQKTLEKENDLLVYAKVQYAESLVRIANYSEAKVLLQEALSVIRRSEALQYKLGPKALLDLGNILDREGDFPAAGKIFQELVEDYERKGDTENPNYIAAMGSLARISMVQGKHGEGLRYMRKGLELSTRIMGERNRTTLAMLINLGQALTDLGEYEDALIYTERGYRIFKEVFGEKAPDTAFIAVNYAYILLKLGRFEESGPLLDGAIELTREQLGLQHPYTINAQYVQSLFLLETGRPSESESLIRDVLVRSQDALGPDMDTTLECKDLLGRILFQSGDVEGSERLHRQVLEVRLQIQRGNSSSTANTMFNLAENLYQQGKYTESGQWAERALRSRFEVYGGDHPITRESVDLLMEVYAASGQSDQAVSLLESLGIQN